MIGTTFARDLFKYSTELYEKASKSATFIRLRRNWMIQHRGQQFCSLMVFILQSMIVFNNRMKDHKAKKYL
jgi:hypothetical protein